MNKRIAKKVYSFKQYEPKFIILDKIIKWVLDLIKKISTYFNDNEKRRKEEYKKEIRQPIIEKTIKRTKKYSPKPHLFFATGFLTGFLTVAAVIFIILVLMFV
jgi:hypothetical protein